MHQFTLPALAAAFFMLNGANALSATLTKAEYTTQKTAISDQYRADRRICKESSGNTKDICIEEARGKSKIAKAQLEADYKPSDKHHTGVRLAKANAAYAIGKENCETLDGDNKADCMSTVNVAFSQP
jgi:hypothetical protein